MSDRLAKFLEAICAQDYKELERTPPELLNATDEFGTTPLMNALLCEAPSPDIVKWLLARGADVNAKDSHEGWTALHFASRNQNAQIVGILINNQADVDAVDTDGNTPLWRCLMTASPNLDVVRLLMEAGADPTKKNSHGVSPMDLAVGSGNDLLISTLRGWV